MIWTRRHLHLRRSGPIQEQHPEHHLDHPPLDPDGPHTIRLQVRVNDTLPDGALLENRFTISCDELEPKSGSIYTPVQNGTLLSINKTALQKAVRRGEEVSYIITVCNNGGQPATNVTVRDVFDSAVELVSAWPEMVEEGVWHFASLGIGQCVQMGLTVRVPRTDVLYQSQQNVTGQGFVRSYRDYSTRGARLAFSPTASTYPPTRCSSLHPQR